MKRAASSLIVLSSIFAAASVAACPAVLTTVDVKLSPLDFTIWGVLIGNALLAGARLSGNPSKVLQRAVFASAVISGAGAGLFLANTPVIGASAYLASTVWLSAFTLFAIQRGRVGAVVGFVVVMLLSSSNSADLKDIVANDYTETSYHRPQNNVTSDVVF